MRKGIVIHIDPISGRGCIEDENEQDIFFDLDPAPSDIQIGTTVEFQIIIGPNGLVASNVQAILLQKQYQPHPV